MRRDDDVVVERPKLVSLKMYVEEIDQAKKLAMLLGEKGGVSALVRRLLEEEWARVMKRRSKPKPKR